MCSWVCRVLMCLRVCRVSPHLQLMLFSGKNCFLNSPVYAWLVQHWIRRPNTSCWFCSSVKCLVGLRDGGILFVIANLPLWGAFCQLRIQAVCVVALAQRRANTLEVPIGALHASWVASSAWKSGFLPFWSVLLLAHCHKNSPMKLGHPKRKFFRSKTGKKTGPTLKFYVHKPQLLQGIFITMF